MMAAINNRKGKQQSYSLNTEPTQKNEQKTHQ